MTIEPHSNAPTIAILLPPAARDLVLSPGAQARLRGMGKLRTTDETTLSPELLGELIAGTTVAVTGWGTPSLAPYLNAAPDLKLVGHCAGSVRNLVPAEVFEGGPRVTHAAAAISNCVAEFVIGQILMALREGHMFDRRMKAGDGWAFGEYFPGRLLGARTVGVVGAGHIGRAVMRLLRPFGCRILVQDPVLSPAVAADLGAELVSLDELLTQSDVLTLHAPKLPETDNMIGATQLARLKDGAVLVNMGRGSLIDEPALIAELRKNRFEAVLDVFATEPLPLDSELLRLNNVIVSPHVAGHTSDGHRQQGDLVVDEVERFLNGEPLQFEVTRERLALMA